MLLEISLQKSKFAVQREKTEMSNLKSRYSQMLELQKSELAIGELEVVHKVNIKDVIN